MKQLFSIICIFSLSLSLIAQKVSYKPLSTQEKDLIKSSDSKQIMRVIQVTETEELKVLKTASEDIDPTEKLLKQLSKRMFITVMDPFHPGVGIAAPQVGINRNAIWVMRFDKQGEPFEFLINPKLVWTSELMRKGKEGCLSIPEIYDDVYRHYTVKITYFDLENVFHEEIVEGYTAVILQHEIDHLNGTLFTDRLKEQKDLNYENLSDEVGFYIQDKKIRN